MVPGSRSTQSLFTTLSLRGPNRPLDGGPPLGSEEVATLRFAVPGCWFNAGCATLLTDPEAFMMEFCDRTSVYPWRSHSVTELCSPVNERIGPEKPEPGFRTDNQAAHPLRAYIWAWWKDLQMPPQHSSLPVWRHEREYVLQIWKPVHI